MKLFLHRLLAIFVLTVVGLLIWGANAPKNFALEREIIVNKPKDFVFQELRLLKNQNQWSPWAKKDPKIEMEYRGMDGLVGFVSAWSGNSEVGVGEQEIKKMVEGERIDYELRFKKPFEGTSNSYLITESVDANQTKVKWGMAGENKFPFNIVCMLMNMPKKLTAEFDIGLQALKSHLEK